MKVAVVGCGAVGSYYGARLAVAGHDVHFLLRSDYDHVRRHGVFIESREGNFRAHPNCAIRPAEIGPSELVLIGLKTTANHCYPDLLPPLVDSGSAVLTLQNGLGNEEQLARLFPPDQILGGLCFVCLNRISPGVVRHLDYGLIVMGEFSGLATARTRSLVEQFSNAGIPCRLTVDLRRAHWEKLIWNVPFNGLGVAATAGYEAVMGGALGEAAPLGKCLPTDVLLDDPKWAALVRELMLEVVRVACAKGMDLPEELADKQIARTRTMGSYRASTLIDFERGFPLELEGIFIEPLKQARDAGVPTPRLESLCAVLKAISQRAGRSSAA